MVGLAPDAKCRLTMLMLRWGQRLSAAQLPAQPRWLAQLLGLTLRWALARLPEMTLQRVPAQQGREPPHRRAWVQPRERLRE